MFHYSREVLTASGCELMAEQLRSKARLEWSNDEAIRLHKEAFQDLWSALSLGQHQAAIPLAEYYFYNTGVITQNKLFSIVLVNIYNKFQLPQNKLYSSLTEDQEYLQQGLSIEDKTVIEVYALKGYEDLMRVKQEYRSNQKIFSPGEVKQNIARLWDKIEIKCQLTGEIHSFLSKNPLYAYRFEELVQKVKNTIEPVVPKNPRWPIHPGHCSADNSDNDVPALGDNIKDVEDV